MQVKKHDRYIFTWFMKSWEVPDIKEWKQIKHIKFIIYQHEETKLAKPHMQGYIETSKPISWLKMKKRIQKLFPQKSLSYLVPAKGTKEQNIAYCSKDESCQGFYTRVQWDKETKPEPSQTLANC